MDIMCVKLCLFSTLSHRVGALRISIIILIKITYNYIVNVTVRAEGYENTLITQHVLKVSVFIMLKLDTSSLMWALTLSLPQPVTFPGWKMHRRTCKQYIFCPITHLLSMLCVLMKSFHNLMRKRKQKGLTVSNFTLLSVVFEWHCGRG